MSPEIDYQAMNERIEAGVRKEKNLSKFVLFLVNLALFVVFLVLAWQMFVQGGGTPPTMADMINLPGVPKPTSNPLTSALLMMSVGCGIAVFIQAVMMIIDTPLGERSIRDRAAGREMRKAMARAAAAAADEPEKRKGMMRLTDDGELEAIEDVTAVEVPIQQNRKG